MDDLVRSALTHPDGPSHGPSPRVQAPYVSAVKVSLVDLPRIDVSIRPGALGAPFSPCVSLSAGCCAVRAGALVQGSERRSVSLRNYKVDVLPWCSRMVTRCV